MVVPTPAARGTEPPGRASPFPTRPGAHDAGRAFGEFYELYCGFLALETRRGAMAIERAYAHWSRLLGQEVAYRLKLAALEAVRAARDES